MVASFSSQYFAFDYIQVDYQYLSPYILMNYMYMLASNKLTKSGIDVWALADDEIS